MTKKLEQTAERVAREAASEDGQALVEYSLILAFVVVVAVTLLDAVGEKTGGMLSLILSAF